VVEVVDKLLVLLEAGVAVPEEQTILLELLEHPILVEEVVDLVEYCHQLRQVATAAPAS
jgi:hypothetical protein